MTKRDVRGDGRGRKGRSVHGPSPCKALDRSKESAGADARRGRQVRSKPSQGSRMNCCVSAVDYTSVGTFLPPSRKRRAMERPASPPRPMPSGSASATHHLADEGSRGWNHREAFRRNGSRGDSFGPSRHERAAKWWILGQEICHLSPESFELPPQRSVRATQEPNEASSKFVLVELRCERADPLEGVESPPGRSRRSEAPDGRGSW